MRSHFKVCYGEERCCSGRNFNGRKCQGSVSQPRLKLQLQNRGAKFLRLSFLISTCTHTIHQHYGTRHYFLLHLNAIGIDSIGPDSLISRAVHDNVGPWPREKGGETCVLRLTTESSTTICLLLVSSHDLEAHLIISGRAKPRVFSRAPSSPPCRFSICEPAGLFEGRTDSNCINESAVYSRIRRF